MCVSLCTKTTGARSTHTTSTHNSHNQHTQIPHHGLLLLVIIVVVAIAANILAQQQWWWQRRRWQRREREGQGDGAVFCCKAFAGCIILIAVVNSPLLMSASLLSLSPLPFTLPLLCPLLLPPSPCLSCRFKLIVVYAERIAVTAAVFAAD